MTRGTGDKVAGYAGTPRPESQERDRGSDAAGRARPDPVLRRLCAPLLVFEAIVIILAIPVAVNIGHRNGDVAGVTGGALAVVAMLLAGVVGRRRWTLLVGSALQVLIIASGVVVPAMYALGVIFGGLWAGAFWLARHLRTLDQAARSNGP